MDWRTYDRKLEEIFAAEEIVDAHTLASLLAQPFDFLREIFRPRAARRLFRRVALVEALRRRCPIRAGNDARKAA
jgi:hypothetical protein